MSFKDIFIPTYDNLIIAPDPVADVIAGIFLPENRRSTKPQTGKILAAGPLCHPVYAVGVRIVFGAFDGTDLKMGGETAKLVPQISVLAYTDGQETEDPLLDESWKEHLKPPPGALLVERAAQPLCRGEIWIPDSTRLVNRSSEAVVVAEDADEQFEVGERVFMAGSVSRKIPLGRREDVELWVARPREISGRLLDEPPEEVETEENPHLAALPELSRAVRDVSAFEEGDTRAPR